MEERITKICFVVDAWTRTKGGAELQCYLIAKGLSAKGWNVAYITLTESEPETAFQVFHAEKKLRGEGWLARYSRALSLFRLLNRIKPDILLLTYAGSLSGFVTCYALLHRQKIVYRVAEEAAADLALGRHDDLHGRGFLARLLHLLTVRNAHVIVANAEYVEREFHSWLPGKNIQVIRNGHEIEPVRRAEPSHVLWIGRFVKWKNPALYVKLARELPNIRFLMHGWGPLYDDTIEESKGVPNLAIMGEVGGEAKRRAFENALAFVSTSMAEGFPNTLIEAGIHKVPYVSFVDPDEVICRHNLGFHVRSFTELVEKTKLLVTHSELRMQMGENIRSYVEKNHKIENTVAGYDKLLRALLQSP